MNDFSCKQSILRFKKIIKGIAIDLKKIVIQIKWQEPIKAFNYCTAENE